MNRKYRRAITFLAAWLMIFQQSGFAQIAGELHIVPLAGITIGAAEKFRPLHLRYLAYDRLNNNFNLILDRGSVSGQGSEVQETTARLFRYFLTGVSLPNDAFWVNLRPDSPDNTIDADLGRTEAGRIMLAADVQLKKDTAAATSPETPEGKLYWDRLYEKAAQLFGTENISLPSLVRPWIVPDEVIVRETADSAYVYKATLKIMLEQDYLKGSAAYNFSDPRLKALNEYSAQLMRELVLPKLTRAVNSSKHYAELRQVYYSLVLAYWFKSRFRGKLSFASFVNPPDSRSLIGLLSQGAWSKQDYFKEYQKSFKNGEYNLKQSVQTLQGQSIRSYFSGGIQLLPAEEPGAFGSPAGASSPVKVIPAVSAPVVCPGDINMTMKAGKPEIVRTGMAPETASSPANGEDDWVQPSLDELSRGWDRDALDPKRNTFCAWVPLLQSNIISQIGKNKDVLVLGPGRGELEVRIRDNGNRVVGVDISEEMVRVAGSKGLTVYRGDAHHLENIEGLKDAKFDVVFLPESIGYLRPREAMEQARNMLREGGRVIIVTYPPELAKVHTYRQYRSDTGPGLKLLMEEAGFRDVAYEIMTYEGRGLSEDFEGTDRVFPLLYVQGYYVRDIEAEKNNIWQARQAARRFSNLEIPGAPVSLQSPLSEVMARFHQVEEAIRSAMLKTKSLGLVSGARNFIRALRPAGIPVEIASGGHQDIITSELGRYGILGNFDAVNAEGVAKDSVVTRMLEKQNRKVLVIGDAVHDIASGRKADAGRGRVVTVMRLAGQKVDRNLVAADYYINDFAEFSVSGNAISFIDFSGQRVILNDIGGVVTDYDGTLIESRAATEDAFAYIALEIARGYDLDEAQTRQSAIRIWHETDGLGSGVTLRAIRDHLRTQVASSPIDEASADGSDELFDQALAKFKNGYLYWDEVSIGVQRQFVLMLARETGKDPSLLNTGDFTKKISAFGGKSLSRLMAYYKLKYDLANFKDAVKKIKEVVLMVEDKNDAKYGSFNEAFRLFIGDGIQWNKTSPGIWKNFLELLAQGCKKDPGELRSSDFNRLLPELGSRKLFGLLDWYKTSRGLATFILALQGLKREVGIVDTTGGAYVSFESALGEFILDRIRWERVPFAMAAQFMTMLADGVRKDLRDLIPGDFYKEVPQLSGKKLSGLLQHYQAKWGLPDYGQTLQKLKVEAGITVSHPELLPMVVNPRVPEEYRTDRIVWTADGMGKITDAWFDPKLYTLAVKVRISGRQNLVFDQAPTVMNGADGYRIIDRNPRVVYAQSAEIVYRGPSLARISFQPRPRVWFINPDMLSPLYEILGASLNADKDEIRTAYRNLMRSLHPDNAGNGESADRRREEFSLIAPLAQRAYVMLSRGKEDSTLLAEVRKFKKSQADNSRAAAVSASSPVFESEPTVKGDIKAISDLVWEGLNSEMNEQSQFYELFREWNRSLKPGRSLDWFDKLREQVRQQIIDADAINLLYMEEPDSVIRGRDERGNEIPMAKRVLFITYALLVEHIVAESFPGGPEETSSSPMQGSLRRLRTLPGITEDIVQEIIRELKTSPDTEAGRYFRQRIGLRLRLIAPGQSLTWQRRVQLTASEERLLRLITPAYAYDYDGLLSKPNQPMEEDTVRLLARRTVMGYYQATNTSKSRQELLLKNKLEIWSAWREALIAELAALYKNPEEAADDLAGDLVSFGMDAGMTRFLPGPGVKSIYDAVMDRSYSRGYSLEDKERVSAIIQDETHRPYVIFPNVEPPLTGSMVVKTYVRLEGSEYEERAALAQAYSRRFAENGMPFLAIPDAGNAIDIRWIDPGQIDKPSVPYTKARQVEFLLQLGFCGVTAMDNEILRGDAADIKTVLKGDIDSGRLRIIAVDNPAVAFEMGGIESVERAYGIIFLTGAAGQTFERTQEFLKRENEEEISRFSEEAGSSPVTRPETFSQDNLEALGGIDFRTLPIVTRAVAGLNSALNSGAFDRLNYNELEQERQKIERMIASGIVPSSERTLEFAQAACLAGLSSNDKNKIVLCIAGILRQQEETLDHTQPELNDALVLLGAGISFQNLETAFPASKP